MERSEQSLLYGEGKWFQGKKIGQGSFGSVHLAFFPLSTTCYHSHKFPPIAAVKSASLTMTNTLIWEKKAYNDLQDCPFIVKCLRDDITMVENVQEYSNINGKLVYNLFLEYASRGTLFDFMRKNLKNVYFLESQICRFTRSILRGIERIHKEGLVHCDIKLENILLFDNQEGDTEELVAKVSDLGLAKWSTNLEKYNVRGTWIYWSPEMFIDGVQGQPSDIWALGLVVLIMLTGEMPRYERGRRMATESTDVITFQSPITPCGFYSEAAESFINKCFRYDPAKRPTASELLCHPFVAEHTQKFITLPTKNYNVDAAGPSGAVKEYNQVIVID